MHLELSIIISQIVAFLVLLWILKIFAWKPFLKLLSERQSKIQEEFQAIDLQKLELNKLKDEYRIKLEQIDEMARQTMHEALARSENSAQQISEKAQNQAKALLEKAKKAIDLEIVQAHKLLKKNLVNLVIEATEKLMEEKNRG